MLNFVDATPQRDQSLQAQAGLVWNEATGKYEFSEEFKRLAEVGRQYEQLQVEQEQRQAEQDDYKKRRHEFEFRQGMHDMHMGNYFNKYTDGSEWDGPGDADFREQWERNRKVPSSWFLDPLYDGRPGPGRLD